MEEEVRGSEREEDEWRGYRHSFPPVPNLRPNPLRMKEEGPVIREGGFGLS